MKKSFFDELNQREFNLLCDFMNGRTVDFTDVYWRATFMSGLRGYSNEEQNHFERLKVDKEELFLKLESHTNIRLIVLISALDEFWDKDEEMYHDMDMQCPSSKVHEILTDDETQSPISWNPEQQTLEEFIDETMENEYDFFVNILDLKGDSKGICAVKEEDLIGFMLSISNERWFARIQRNDGFVKNDFVSFTN